MMSPSKQTISSSGEEQEPSIPVGLSRIAKVWGYFLLRRMVTSNVGFRSRIGNSHRYITILDSDETHFAIIISATKNDLVTSQYNQRLPTTSPRIKKMRQT